MKTLHRAVHVALSFLLLVGGVTAVFAGGEQETEESTEVNPLGIEIFGDVEPLDETVELTIALGAGWHQTFPYWLIEELGGFDMVGIDVSFEVFGNGPVMVEALGADTWDMGSYGLGGIITGTIAQQAVLLAPSIHDSGTLRFFTSREDPIYLAGNTVAGSPSLYGTAETWRGREIYVQTGTTLHYALIKGLDQLGLTADDVRLTHMDVPNANAALRSGNGDEIAGLWAANVFDDVLLERFAPVLRGDDVGVTLVASHVANPRSYADPEKTKAIRKALELYFLASEWVMANLEEAGENYFRVMAFDQGFDARTEDLVNYIVTDPLFGLAEAYDLVTTTMNTELGELSLFAANLYDATNFFVGMGNYEASVLDTMVGVFDTTYIEEIFESR